jgi:hypothetical protein
VTAEARPARRLSSHPEAVKARRWRGRKAAERRGAVLVALIVEPAEIRALRRLGLLAGSPWGWREPAPDPSELEAALHGLLAAAGPLAALATALRGHGTERA